jgi:divalent metal cation (Fe/Co/Zn/Cd) transporter
MGFALALAWENKRLLVGESLPTEVEDRLREAIRSHEGVVHVDRMRTVFFGPGNVLVTADVSFDAKSDADGLDDDITAIEEKLRAVDDRVGMVYIEPEV